METNFYFMQLGFWRPHLYILHIDTKNRETEEEEEEEGRQPKTKQHTKIHDFNSCILEEKQEQQRR